MSYIHHYNDNYYKPSENLTNLFKEKVIQPFERDLPTLAEDVKNKRLYYWKDIARILEQGQSNFDTTSFDKPSNKHYLPKHKVSIYSVHYMPMHLFSSYHIFTTHSIPISDKVVFIDFGCGPLTSGIAFWAFAKQSDITYIGIDKSQWMLNKAVEINEYGPNRYRYPFFNKFELILEYDYNHLTELLDQYIEPGDGTQIIFNFCYFFASPTLNIANLSDILISIVRQYNAHKMYIVYQNAVSSSLKLSEKWYIFKNNVLKSKNSRFRSSISSDQHIQPFKYNRLINCTLHRDAKVYSDTLYHV